ncbi:MAG: DNA primase [Clostridiales bacterium]|nr:MAG: DNA primase [Clostridiales bacterium]
MGRYKREVKDYILDRVDIVSLISSHIELKPVGPNFKGLCPFHGEKTPSFSVSTSWNKYKCFGCNESGDAITFVMKMQSLEFLDALEYLAATNGIDISKFLDENSFTVDYRVKLSYELNLEAAKFYRDMLLKNTFAIEYLTDRNIDKWSLIRFGIGYAPDGFQNLYNYLKGKGYKDDEVLFSNLVKKSQKTDKLYDTFRNRIIIPIFDNRKRIVGFGARSINDEMPKYLNSSESDFFKKSKVLYGQGINDNLDRGSFCILVEGYMDVIKLCQFGFKNVYASMGTSLTESQAYELSKNFNKLIFAYDMDEAGRTAIDRSIEMLERYKLDIRVLELTKAKDPDEYIDKFGIENFKTRLENSLDLYKYKIMRLKSGLDMNKPFDKKLYVDKTMNVLSNLKSDVEVEIYIQEVSVYTGINIGSLKAEYNRIKGRKNKIKEDVSNVSLDNEKKVLKNAEIKKSEMRNIDKIEKKLLEISMSSKEKFNLIKYSIGQNFVNSDINSAMYILKLYYDKKDEFDFNVAVEVLDLDKVVELEKYKKNISYIENEIDIQILLISREKELCLSRIAKLTEDVKKLSLLSSDEDKISMRKKQTELISERKKYDTLLAAERVSFD